MLIEMSEALGSVFVFFFAAVGFVMTVGFGLEALGSRAWAAARVGARRLGLTAGLIAYLIYMGPRGRGRS